MSSGFVTEAEVGLNNYCILIVTNQTFVFQGGGEEEAKAR